MQPIDLEADTQYLKSKSKGGDSADNSIHKPPHAGGKHANKYNTANKQHVKGGSKMQRARLESEESSDADAHRNTMMFELDM